MINELKITKKINLIYRKTINTYKTNHYEASYCFNNSVIYKKKVFNQIAKTFF